MPRTLNIEAKCPPAVETCPQRAVCDQARRKTLVRQLQQAQRMGLAANIATGLAHDFKNLITTIHLHADLIGMALPPDAAQQQNVSNLRHAPRQSNVLLDRLFDVIRPQEGSQLLRIDEELAAMDCLIQGVAG